MPTAARKEEKRLHALGYGLVAGIDEAGRGPLAGPVCAAAVVFDPGTTIRGINDSKALDPERRDDLFDKIMERALAVGVGFASADEIDAINILRATHLAVRRALRNMPLIPDFLLLDALRIVGCTIPQQSFIRGDSRCFSIAAASIVAKVSRDRLMTDYAAEYPHYEFQRHKGYGTPAHRELIERHGPCTIHRVTFLVDWFGSIPIRNSLTYTRLMEQLNGCDCRDSLSGWLGEVRSRQGFLPRCEWQNLLEEAGRRHAETLNIPARDSMAWNHESRGSI